MTETSRPIYTISEESVDFGLDISIALAVFLHGFLDVVVTIAAWELERNGIVLLLGPRGWAFAKIVSITLVVLMWWYTREGLFSRDLTMFFLGAWSGIGAAAIALNVVALGWL